MKTPDDSTGGSTELLVSAIVPDPKNRKEHDGEQLRSLAESIKTDGLLQPVVVRQIAPGKYMLVAGERRWRAHGLLKLAKIPAIVTSTGAQAPTAADVRKRAAENFQREDLTPIEEAQLFRELHVEHKIPQAEIAKIRGRGNQSTVANALRLLELPAEVQKLVQGGLLTRAHGIALCRFSRWPKIVKRMADLAIKGGETSKELEDDDVPYSHTLKREGLIVECNPYDWQRGYDYTVPKELRQDPAFIGDEHDCWCMEPAKWAPEKKRQDEAAAKKQKAAEKAEGTRQSTMSPAEKKARQKKIADNKRNRIESAAATTSAFERLETTKALDKGMLIAVVARVLSQSAYAESVEDAAAKIGIKLPSGVVKSSWNGGTVSFEKLSTLSELDLIRVTAAAVVHHHGEEAVKYSAQPPDEILALLPKGEHKKLQRVDVSVTMTASDNVARAGNVTKSCTSDPALAAREAAARYLGCAPGDLKLTVKVPGKAHGSPRVYLAAKGGAK